MARLRYNGLSTTLGGSLTNVATSVTFAAALTHSNGTNVPTIVSPDYIPLAILGATGHLSEIVYLTAYTAGATTGTITRGVEGTTGVSHSSGDPVTQAALVADSSIFSGYYGDGSDGNVTVSTTVTLTRDMLYDTLTVASGGILKPNGFRIQCKTAAVVQSGGALQYDGLAGSGSTGGASAYATSSAPLSAGANQGGNGGSAANGSSGGTVASSIGGASGAGGAGGTTGGGASRTATAPTATMGTVRCLPMAATGIFATYQPVSIALSGGAGGSGGGGDGTNAGGGGGGGAGVLILNARAVSNSGTISANGGAGGNGSTGNTGGGGGGGGGAVIVNTSVAITGSNPTATGGAGGTKTGTGVNGNAGSSGNVFVNVWI